MSNMRVALQPAFVLHARPYRDTSLIVDLMTQSHGRIGAIARGARSQKSRYRGFLSPFVPIMVAWSGYSDLVNISEIESFGAPIILMGRPLLAAMYVNELMVRLLHQHDPHSEVFDDYKTLLQQLQQNVAIEPVLRAFEKNLLQAIGYGFEWHYTADSDQPILANNWYAFTAELGFCSKLQQYSGQPIFSGEHILAIANDAFDDPAVLRSAKQIMRLAMLPRLGKRVIKSRELFS
ncbi:MAG: DNA repair protein RecO [Pseudomonadota bacterium]|nr:DNA repair protein RecO [Pseudomonadota bacterium]